MPNNSLITLSKLKILVISPLPKENPSLKPEKTKRPLDFNPKNSKVQIVNFLIFTSKLSKIMISKNKIHQINL